MDIHVGEARGFVHLVGVLCGSYPILMASDQLLSNPDLKVGPLELI